MSSLLAEGLSPATVRSYRQIPGQVLNQAVADGLLLTNPVEGVQASKVAEKLEILNSHWPEQILIAANA